MKDLQHGSDLGPREESSVIGHGSPSTTTCEKLLHGVCEERTDEWFVLFVKVAQVIDGKKATGIACTTVLRTSLPSILTRSGCARP